MIQSARQYHISEIFSIDSRIKYVIPKFQREYIWGKEQWENLFDDVIENEKGHFFGSIICINKGKDVFDIMPLEIIDGQQRLATISLLYAAIYERLLEENRTDDDFITGRNNLKHRMLNRSKQDELKIELSYQNHNFADYKAIMNELSLCDDHYRPPNLGTRRIYKTYTYLKNRISGLKYGELNKILDKINSALFVKIEVNSHADAFTLFESLNNRGIPLSAIDLVKNNILANLEKKKIKSIDAAFNEWVKLINNLPDYSVQERFLRQYYNAFRYKNKIRIRGIRRATRSNLIKIYDKLISNDVSFIFEELIEKSNKYNLLIEPDKNKEIKFYNGLIDLLHIGAALAYTFLLYLLSEHGKKQNLIKETIDFLVKYFVRRNITDIPGTRDLDLIFINLIDECEKNIDSLRPKLIKDLLTSSDKFATNEFFKEKLRGDIYEDNVAAARFILCKIEETHQTREVYTDLWERNKEGKYIWTIEHIFPEGKNIPKEWIGMIAGGDEEKAKDLQMEWVHKLGNLTLTAYNPKLSNYSFEKKKFRKDSKGNYVGYKNGLYLNRKLARSKSWTIEKIQAGTEELLKEAMRIFRV